MRKKLIVFITLITMAAALLGGYTMAWFTSQDAVEDNLFTAGKLEIELEVDGEGVEEHSVLFEATGYLAPGDTKEAVVAIKHSDDSTIPFKVQGRVTGESVYYDLEEGEEGTWLPAGEDNNLADQLILTITKVDAAGEHIADIYEGTLADLLATGFTALGADDLLALGDTAYLKFQMKFSETAGDAYQDTRFNGTITFIATQKDDPAQYQTFSFKKDEPSVLSFDDDLDLEMTVTPGEDFSTIIDVERYSYDTTPPPAGMNPAGIYLNINSSEPLPVGSEVVLRVSYDPADLPDGVAEEDLKLFHYTSGEWKDITDSVDTVNKVITSIPISSFSIFGVFTAAPAAPPVTNTTTGVAYQTIQAAINDAAAGDVLEVDAGTYNESITISKADLTLQSKDGAAATTIDGDGASNTVKITADGVTVDGFTITGANSSEGAVYLDRVDNCTIKNNTVKNNERAGIYLRQADNNRIENNTISHNRLGIYMNRGSTATSASCNGNTIIGNTIANNSSSGISLTTSYSQANAATGNQFLENTIRENGGKGFNVEGGVWVANTIEGNTISGHQKYGIHNNGGAQNNTIKDNTIDDNNRGGYSGAGVESGDGIYIGSHDTGSRATFGNLIEGNTITNNWNGIYLYGRSGGSDNYNYGNTIQSNTISSNAGNGIYLRDGVNNNTIVENKIVNNATSRGYGVHATQRTVGNTATHNWWGSADGPGQDGANGISNVTYAPWYVDEAMTALSN